MYSHLEVIFENFKLRKQPVVKKLSWKVPNEVGNADGSFPFLNGIHKNFKRIDFPTKSPHFGRTVSYRSVQLYGMT